MVERTVPVGGSHGSIGFVISIRAYTTAGGLDARQLAFHFRYRRQAIYKTTTMTDKTLANPSEGRTGDRTRGTSDDLVDSLGAEKGQRAR
jgi:hypothetical protein